MTGWVGYVAGKIDDMYQEMKNWAGRTVVVSIVFEDGADRAITKKRPPP